MTYLQVQAGYNFHFYLISELRLVSSMVIATATSHYARKLAVREILQVLLLMLLGQSIIPGKLVDDAKPESVDSRKAFQDTFRAC